MGREEKKEIRMAPMTKEEALRNATAKIEKERGKGSVMKFGYQSGVMPQALRELTGAVMEKESSGKVICRIWRRIGR